MTANIVFSAATLLLALVLGLVLRRLLVRRLKKTVLDNWIIQTLGALVIIPPLIVGGLISLAIWSNLIQFIQHLHESYGIDLVTIGWNLIETMILLALGIGIARTVRKLTMSTVGESRIDINIRTLFARVLSLLTFIIVGIWTLSIWQIPFVIPVAFVGVLTVAVTVSVQDIIKDLVAGFYLLIERPFHIGDQIIINTGVNTYIGRVQDIELRATKLRMVSGEEVTVPNTFVFGNAVVNNTFFGERRGTIVVTMLQTDFSREETCSRILSTLQEIEQVMAKPEPQVMISSFAEEKVTLLVRFWVASSPVIDISPILYTLHDIFPKADLTVHEPVS